MNKRFDAALFVVLIVFLAGSSDVVWAREVTQVGTPGFDGARGDHGDPGEKGADGSGGKIGPAVADSADPVNVAFADGSSGGGGSGGSGGAGSPEDGSDGDADGGDGGNGGAVESAIARAATDWTTGISAGDPIDILSNARARGGAGGNGGSGGTAAGNGRDGRAGNAGSGAKASATAEAVNRDHGSEAVARADGGRGGSAVREGNGGQGGGASAIAGAATTGGGDATANARAKGGAGGRVRGLRQVAGAGAGGSGGNGSARATAEGELGNVRADARGDGGSAGIGAPAGSAGTGGASAVARNQGPGKVYASARSTGGNSGRARGSGAGSSVSARAVSTGGGPVRATANAGGGAGPGGGASVSMHNAAMVRSSGQARLQQVARGGSGLDGSSGGDAESSVAFDHPGEERLTVQLAANAGAGGSGGDAAVRAVVSNLGAVVVDGTSRGGHGGHGGRARVGPLFARSHNDEQVTVRASASGGSGSTPAPAQLDNAVNGRTAGRLRLEQDVRGGNSDVRGGTGASAFNRLHGRQEGERLYLLAKGKGGDGHEGGAGAESAIDLAGSNGSGELHLRGDSLGGAGGSANLAGSGGGARLTAAATGGEQSGAMDIRVETTGGPGGKSGTDLSPEDRARIDLEQGPDFDWSAAFGAGGPAQTDVRAVSAAREDVLVVSQARGGSAGPEGLFPAGGGAAQSDVLVVAEHAPDIRVDVDVDGGSARLDGAAGPAVARLEVRTRHRAQVFADAAAGAGGEFADADAYVRGIASLGTLVARATTRVREQVGPLNVLRATAQVEPRDTHALMDADTGAASLSALGVQALGGLEAEADRADMPDRHALAVIRPYPSGEPGALFAAAMAVRHPVTAAQAAQYRDAADSAVRALAEPLTVTLEYHWPAGRLPPYVVRGDGVGRQGDGAARIDIAGLDDDAELGTFTVNDGTAEHALSGIFEDDWVPERLLAGAGRQSLNGLRVTVTVAPGDAFDGRWLFVRSL